MTTTTAVIAALPLLSPERRAANYAAEVVRCAGLADDMLTWANRPPRGFRPADWRNSCRRSGALFAADADTARARLAAALAEMG